MLSDLRGIFRWSTLELEEYFPQWVLAAYKYRALVACWHTPHERNALHLLPKPCHQRRGGGLLLISVHLLWKKASEQVQSVNISKASSSSIHPTLFFHPTLWSLFSVAGWLWPASCTFLSMPWSLTPEVKYCHRSGVGTCSVDLACHTHSSLSLGV